MIGCGVDFNTRELFFTRNGQFLGTSFSSQYSFAKELQQKMFVQTENFFQQLGYAVKEQYDIIWNNIEPLLGICD